MKKTISIIIIVFVISIILVFNYRNSRIEKAYDKISQKGILLNNSDVYYVLKGNVSNVLPFTGDLGPLNQTDIYSEVSAVAIKVLVDAGEFVKKGQVLAILDDSEMKELVVEQEAQLETAKSKFALDKNKLEKEKELFQQGFISKFAYDELKTNYQSSLQKINQQKASLKRSRKQLSNTIIKAPFSGYIYKRFIDQGQLASQNNKLFSLADLTTLQIIASIPSSQIGNVHEHEKVVFHLENNKTVSYIGEIDRINPVAQSATRSYLIYITFDNRHAKLKAGQFVNGIVIVQQMQDVLYIPKQAIKYNDNKAYVLQVVNNKVVSKAIDIIIENKIDGICGIKNLHLGDIVISNDVMNVKAGDLVNISN